MLALNFQDDVGLKLSARYRAKVQKRSFQVLHILIRTVFNEMRCCFGSRSLFPITFFMVCLVTTLWIFIKVEHSYPWLALHIFWGGGAVSFFMFCSLTSSEVKDQRKHVFMAWLPWRQQYLRQIYDCVRNRVKLLFYNPLYTSQRENLGLYIHGKKKQIERILYKM